MNYFPWGLHPPAPPLISWPRLKNEMSETETDSRFEPDPSKGGVGLKSGVRFCLWLCVFNLQESDFAPREDK